MNFYGTSNFNDVRIRIYFWDNSYQVTGNSEGGNWRVVLDDADYGYFTDQDVGSSTTQLYWAGYGYTSAALPSSTSQNDYNILMVQILNSTGLVWNTYTITNNGISLFQSFSQSGTVSGNFSILFESSQDGVGYANIVLNVEYTFLAAAPPNGVMPSISIAPFALTPGPYSVTVTASVLGSSASTTYTYNISQQISISSQQSSNFQNSYSIYITGCVQNYTLYINNSPYCYGSYPVFQDINALCTISYPGSYSIYAQGCYNGNCVNSNTINLNIPASIYYGIIQLKAYIQPININTTYGPIGNNLEFSLDYPEYILTLNITNIGNITLNNVTINLLQMGNVPEVLYNQIPIESLNNININQLQPNQSYILQFNILPLYIGSSSLLLNFNVNGQNIGNAQYNLVVNGPSNNSSLVVSENINYILILAGIIGSIILLI